MFTSESTDLYKTLNITRDASQKDIKKAFRKLSMEFHPDRDRRPGANERFSKINAAYSILSDPVKRKRYDTYGDAGLSNQEEPSADQGFFNLFRAFDFNMFQDRQGEQQNEKNEPTIIPFYISLEQAFFGDLFYITYTRPTVCNHIDDCVVHMASCVGPKVKLVTKRLGPGFVVQNQVYDNQCIDYRKAWKANCQACPNGMTEMQKLKTSIFLDSGVSDGDQIPIENAGAQSLQTKPGDVILLVSILPHPLFERKNNNLYTTVYITVLEALTHFSKTFNHINKKPFTLSKSNVTHDGEVVTLPGLGMPIKTSQSSNQGIKQQAYGDLVVTYRVKYPIFLSAEDQQLIKQALKNVTQWKY